MFALSYITNILFYDELMPYGLLNIVCSVLEWLQKRMMMKSLEQLLAWQRVPSYAGPQTATLRNQSHDRQSRARYTKI